MTIPMTLSRNLPLLHGLEFPYRIYVAGQLTNHGTASKDVIKTNVRIAASVSAELIKKGHYVYCPHTHTWGIEEVFPDGEKPGIEAWMELDRSFMTRWANAFYLMSVSANAYRELGWAEERGYRVFRSLDEVPGVPTEYRHES